MFMQIKCQLKNKTVKSNCGGFDVDGGEIRDVGFYY